MSKKERTVKELQSNFANPRSISPEKLEMLKESLKEFGDLSGIVINTISGKLVSGHQRKKSLDPDAKITITKQYKEATSTGTVAEGYIEDGDNRFSYREVAWEALKEHAGMIAANKHGGKWNNKILTELLHELDSHNIPMVRMGFTEKEINSLMAPVDIPDLSDPGTPATKDSGQVECPSCGHKFFKAESGE